MAAETIKPVIGRSLNGESFEEYTQVHYDLADALEAVMRDRVHTDTWLDLADKLVLKLNGKVSMLPKSVYDKLPDIRGLTSKP